MPLAMHARAESDLAQKRDSAGLQHTGANACQHVGTTLKFENDAVDAVSMENMRQKQAGRTTADDRHLGSYRRFHCRLSYKRSVPVRKGLIAEIGKLILSVTRVYSSFTTETTLPATGRWNGKTVTISHVSLSAGLRGLVVPNDIAG